MQELIEVPPPGKILKVNVTIGNTVEEGGVICVMESLMLSLGLMKMENPILSPVKGSVVEVAVSES